MLQQPCSARHAPAEAAVSPEWSLANPLLDFLYQSQSIKFYDLSLPNSWAPQATRLPGSLARLSPHRTLGLPVEGHCTQQDSRATAKCHLRPCQKVAEGTVTEKIHSVIFLVAWSSQMCVTAHGTVSPWLPAQPGPLTPQQQLPLELILVPCSCHTRDHSPPEQQMQRN